MHAKDESAFVCVLFLFFGKGRERTLCSFSRNGNDLLCGFSLSLSPLYSQGADGPA